MKQLFLEECAFRAAISPHLRNGHPGRQCVEEYCTGYRNQCGNRRYLGENGVRL